MKAKEILKAMVKGGFVNASIYSGKSFKGNKIISGKILEKKEYVLTFEDLCYIPESAIVLIASGGKAFLYEI